MNDDEFRGARTMLSAGLRRRALLHCSVAALAAIGTAGLAPASVWAQQPAVSPTATRRPAVLVVGDSLSAEYGLARGSGWVALLVARLAQQRIAADVVNASISGDTTSGGRSRLPSLLNQHRPAVVVIELGGNDALRGLPIASTRDNLTAMAEAAKAAGAKVVIVGMQIPPNYGRGYADEFAAVFAGVAKVEGAALVPFMLKGVADVPDLQSMFQADRIHPVAAAHPLILDNIWPVLRPLLPR